jgi:drug/metabolite transporter (DMT)-like permease
MGLVAFGGQMFFTAGYKNTSIPLGALLSLTVPVLAVFNGHVLLGEPLSHRFLLGASLILFACGGVGFMEKSQNQPD